MDLFTQLYWIRRYGSTQRFHSIRLLHNETVHHHSSNVALIIIQAFDSPSASLLKAALIHDLPEGVTGDIPSPVKWKLNVTESVNLKNLEKQIFEFYKITYPDLTDNERKILKAADFIDTTFTCLLERANGNREVDWVFRNYYLFEQKSKLLDQFTKLKEVWFSISRSYDQLQRGYIPTLLVESEKLNFWEVNDKD